MVCTFRMQAKCPINPRACSARMLIRTVSTSEGSSGGWNSIPKRAAGDCVALIARQEQRTQHRPPRIDNVKLHLTNMLPIVKAYFTAHPLTSLKK